MDLNIQPVWKVTIQIGGRLNLVNRGQASLNSLACPCYALWKPMAHRGSTLLFPLQELLWIASNWQSRYLSQCISTPNFEATVPPKRPTRTVLFSASFCARVGWLAHQSKFTIMPCSNRLPVAMLHLSPCCLTNRAVSSVATGQHALPQWVWYKFSLSSLILRHFDFELNL